MSRRAKPRRGARVSRAFSLVIWLVQLFATSKKADATHGLPGGEEDRFARRKRCPDGGRVASDPGDGHARGCPFLIHSRHRPPSFVLGAAAVKPLWVMV
jgi:hypothetical protein